MTAPILVRFAGDRTEDNFVILILPGKELRSGLDKDLVWGNGRRLIAPELITESQEKNFRKEARHRM